MNFFQAGGGELLSKICQRLIRRDSKINPIDAADFAGHPDQRYGHLTYSQHGEDLVFVTLFEQMEIERPSYLDVGAHHPVNCSNTALLHRRGSRGVNVDANPDVMEAFRRERPQDINVNVGVAGKPGLMTFYRIDALSGRNTFSKEAAQNFVATNPQFTISDEIPIQVMTLDQIIATYCGSRCPDLLSLDAEGLDYEVLSAASFATRPSILCVETNSGAGRKEDRLGDLLTSRGFSKLIQMGENGIYVDNRR
jgi:FkbM family methyltransferase